MIFDELSLIGYPLDDIDLILYCIFNLGPDFKDIAIVLRAQPSSVTYDQIYEQLVNHELQLSQDEHLIEGPITANYVNKHSSGYYAGKTSPSPNGNSTSPHANTSSKIKSDVCQWCNK